MTRVLIADSDRIVRSSIALLLTHKLGIRQICEIDNFNLLTDCVRQFTPDLLILDWELPGLEVGQLAGICNHFHRSNSHPNIIVMSPHSENEPLAFANGADAFLDKRAPGEEVLALIKHFIPQR